MAPQFGIYAWKNMVTGRMLIGQTGSTVGFAKRRRRYLNELQAGRWENKHFQRSWNKHGAGLFKFIILEKITSNSMLTEREQYYVDHYRKLCGVYNQVGPVDNPRRGSVNSKEHRNKISKALKGQKRHPLSKEHIAKIVVANTGKKRDAQARANISAGKKGVKFSDSHKANLKLASKEKWTKAARKKLSDAKVKRPVIAISKKSGEIKSFNSICAAEKEGFIKGHIIKCLKGERKSHGGYVWKDANK